jgi:hypothetical protein
MQQLLLLVLAAILVAVALVLGLDMYQQSLKQANQFVITQDLLTIANLAQAWFRRPDEFSGGNRSFTNLSFAALNFDSVNVNGSFKLANRQTQSFRVIGTTNGEDSLHVTLTVYPDSVALLNLQP